MSHALEHWQLSSARSRYHFCEDEEVEHGLDRDEYGAAPSGSPGPRSSSVPRPRSGHSVFEASSAAQALTDLGTIISPHYTGSTYELTETGNASKHNLMHQDASAHGKKPSSPSTTVDKHHWGWEIAALALCLSSLAATIGLLVYGDGLPLTKWTFIISFNAIISILGTITRASLAFAVGSCLGQWKWNWLCKRWDNLAVFENFEDASRGPWGSITLLFGFRTRHWAVSGALVTVIMLGFEPFLQSVIQLPGVMGDSPDSSHALLPTSDRLDAGLFYADSNSGVREIPLPSGDYYTVVGMTTQPDLGMTAALYNGFSRRTTGFQQTAAFSCPSGNCTWPIFTSLSVCSACNNVSNHLKKITRHGENLGTIEFHVSQWKGKYITYSLPYVDLTNSDTDRGIDFAASMAASVLDNPGLTISFGKLNTMIAAVGILKAEEAYPSKDVQWNDSIVTATECALYFCTNAYLSGAENGKLFEEKVASWSNRVAESFKATENKDSAKAFEEYNNHSLYTTLGDQDREDLQLFIPTEEARAKGVPGDATTVFNITHNAVGSTIEFIRTDFFKGPGGSKMVWSRHGNRGRTQAPVAESLGSNTDLAGVFANAALSLSNWMREHTNASHPGRMQEYMVLIRVRWEYMTLPLLVVVAGCLFALLTMWETRRLRLRPWGTNVIATLAHSLDPDTREYLREAGRNGQTKEAVRAMLVNLADEGRGLELKAHLD